MTRSASGNSPDARPIAPASLLAQSANATPPSTGTNAVGLRRVAPGILDYHGARLDKNKHRVTFDATVNQRKGLIEYLLVNDKGRVHESLPATKIALHDIHLALLLVVLKKAKKSNISQPLPPSAIDSADRTASENVRIANV